LLKKNQLNLKKGINMLTKKLSILAFLAAMFIGVTACDKQGPAEEAGERADNAAERMGDKIEDATDNAGEKMEDAGDRIEDKTDN
jgi:hyperosmotically inducible protein